jgi:hypothetical protein
VMHLIHSVFEKNRLLCCISPAAAVHLITMFVQDRVAKLLSCLNEGAFVIIVFDGKPNKYKQDEIYRRYGQIKSAETRIKELQAEISALGVSQEDRYQNLTSELKEVALRSIAVFQIIKDIKILVNLKMEKLSPRVRVFFAPADAEAMLCSLAKRFSGFIPFSRMTTIVSRIVASCL